MNTPRRFRIPTEALLRAARSAAERLIRNCGESQTNLARGRSKRERLAAMEEQPVVCPAVLESEQVALAHLSRDPDVRREAANVARATSRLLAAIRRSGAGPKPPQ